MSGTKLAWKSIPTTRVRINRFKNEAFHEAALLDLEEDDVVNVPDWVASKVRPSPCLAEEHSIFSTFALDL